MTDLVPRQPPTARSYLDQQLARFRLAAKAMRGQLEEIDRRIKEVQADLVCVEAAFDALEEESRAATSDRGAA